MSSNSILNMAISVIVGIISIVVAQQIVAAQDTTGWSTALASIAGTLPLVVGVGTIVGAFSFLST
tara:strand:+ start:5924 stop:6118 length:195 start_codon:yes stop_codon:yes gene_type:complete